MADDTAGDPVTGIRWTRRSLRVVARELTRLRHPVSAATVRRLLRARHYSLRVNRKRLAHKTPPDRDAHFRAVVRARRRALRRGEPVVSIDAKEHVLVGRFAMRGRAWTPAPRDVLMHDYRRDAAGVAIPFGVYDVGRDHGFVAVGTTREAPAFATATLAAWWRDVGRAAYPRARRLVIACDSGGANDPRRWAWKHALQRLADATGLRLLVTHYPIGASKWNAIEHRLWNRVSATWAARPLETYEHVVKSIRATRTACGRRCCARLDRRVYAAPGPAPRDRPGRGLRLRRHPRFPVSIYEVRPHIPAS